MTGPVDNSAAGILKRRLLDPHERAIEKQIIDALAWIGVVAKKNVVQPGRYAFSSTGLGKGSSDIVGVDSRQNGRSVFIEVKRAHGRRSAEQTAFLAEMARAGAVVGIVESVQQAIAIVEASRKGKTG